MNKPCVRCVYSALCLALGHEKMMLKLLASVKLVVEHRRSIDGSIAVASAVSYAVDQLMDKRAKDCLEPFPDV